MKRRKPYLFLSILPYSTKGKKKEKSKTLAIGARL